MKPADVRQVKLNTPPSPASKSQAPARVAEGKSSSNSTRKNPPRTAAMPKDKATPVSTGVQQEDPKSSCPADSCTHKSKPLNRLCANQVCINCCKDARVAGSFMRSGARVVYLQCKKHEKGKKAKRDEQAETEMDEDSSVSADEDEDEDEAEEEDDDDDFVVDDDSENENENENQEEPGNNDDEDFFLKRYRDMMARRRKKLARAKAQVKGEDDQVWEEALEEEEAINKVKWDEKSIKAWSEEPIDVEGLRRKWEAQQSRCALTGRPMTTTRKRRNVGSLDRINPSRGYTEDNVQWVCAWVNIMKGGMREWDFFNRCQRLVGAFPRWQNRQGRAPPVFHPLSPPSTPAQASPGPVIQAPVPDSSAADSIRPPSEKRRKMHGDNSTGAVPPEEEPTQPDLAQILAKLQQLETEVGRMGALKGALQDFLGISGVRESPSGALPPADSQNRGKKRKAAAQ